MKFSFEYEVETDNPQYIYTSVTILEELTQEQAERLKNSYNTGKYHYMEEDDTISDIFNEIYEIAIQLEEQDENGNPVEGEVKVLNFRYPKEITKN